MAKPKIEIRTEPLGDNLYIVSVVESVAKGKSVLVYADEFTVDDQGNLAFKIADELIYVLRSGDWKTVQYYEDVEDFIKSVRFMTIEQRLEEILMKQIKEEEARKKAAEEKEIEKMIEEEEAKKKE